MTRDTKATVQQRRVGGVDQLDIQIRNEFTYSYWPPKNSSRPVRRTKPLKSRLFNAVADANNRPIPTRFSDTSARRRG